MSASLGSAHRREAETPLLAARLVHNHLHLLLHLFELADELVDVLHRRAAARRDSAAAAGVEDFGTPALLGRHGADDGLRLLHGVVRNVDIADGAHARQHLEDAGKRAHLLDLLHLAEEIVEREVGVLHPSGN